MKKMQYNKNNSLEEAVYSLDKKQISYLLENMSEEELNRGQSPLFILADIDLEECGKTSGDLIYVFWKLIEHPKFHNVNSLFVDSSGYTYTLLDEYIFQTYRAQSFEKK